MNYTNPFRQRGIQNVERLNERDKSTIKALRELMPTVRDTLNVVFKSVFNFEPTESQYELVEFLNGSFDHYEGLPIDEAIMNPNRSGKGQRGLGKSLCLAVVGFHRILHDLDHIVLLVSGKESYAKDLANAVGLVINGNEAWALLKPPKNASNSSFNIPSRLRLPSKSSSMSYVTIGGGLQSPRADILIADDAEQMNNSDTASKREKLLKSFREFGSIASKGDVVIVGTPQSFDSVYNTLPDAGFSVRMWPARVPKWDSEESYGIGFEYLAPRIKAMMHDENNLTGYGLSGEMSITTDSFLDENTQLKLEMMSNNSGTYELQQLLDISKFNENIFPLDVNDLVVGKCEPLRWEHRKGDYHEGFRQSIPDAQYSMGKWNQKVAFIDPAVSNKLGRDSFVITVMGLHHNQYNLIDMMSLDGGITPENLDKLVEFLGKHQPHVLGVEVNQGGSAVIHSIRESIMKWNRVNPDFKGVETQHIKCVIEEIHNTKMKEKRIVEVMSNVLGSRLLRVDPIILTRDKHCVSLYGDSCRSLFFQIKHISPVKHALKHDDQIDCVAMNLELIMSHENGTMRRDTLEDSIDKQWAREVKRRVRAGRRRMRV